MVANEQLDEWTCCALCEDEAAAIRTMSCSLTPPSLHAANYKSADAYDRQHGAKAVGSEHDGAIQRVRGSRHPAQQDVVSGHRAAHTGPDGAPQGQQPPIGLVLAGYVRAGEVARQAGQSALVSAEGNLEERLQTLVWESYDWWS